VTAADGAFAGAGDGEVIIDELSGVGKLETTEAEDWLTVVTWVASQGGAGKKGSLHAGASRVTAGSARCPTTAAVHAA